MNTNKGNIMCCEYCKDLPSNKDQENMTLVEMLSSKDFVFCGSYKDGYSQLKINYCPICGRNLNPIEHEEDKDNNDICGDYDSYEDIYGGYDPYSLGWDV